MFSGVIELQYPLSLYVRLRRDSDASVFRKSYVPCQRNEHLPNKRLFLLLLHVPTHATSTGNLYGCEMFMNHDRQTRKILGDVMFSKAQKLYSW